MPCKKVIDLNAKMQGLRLCEAYFNLGYFHRWENVSRVELIIENGISKPIGVVSKVFGIVEFQDRVELVEPEDIRFVDETNSMLAVLGQSSTKKEKN